MDEEPLTFNVPPPDWTVDLRHQINSDQNNKSRKNSLHCTFCLLRELKKTIANSKFQEKNTQVHCLSVRC